MLARARELPWRIRAVEVTPGHVARHKTRATCDNDSPAACALPRESEVFPGRLMYRHSRAELKNLPQHELPSLDRTGPRSPTHSLLLPGIDQCFHFFADVPRSRSSQQPTTGGCQAPAAARTPRRPAYAECPFGHEPERCGDRFVPPGDHRRQRELGRQRPSISPWRARST